MKKYLLHFLGSLSACLLLTMLATNLKAQSISSTIGNAVGCVGDTVTVPVSVNMSAGISVSAISMAIGFDSTKLECLGGAQNLISSLQIGTVSNCTTVPGFGKQIRFVWTDLNPITINSQIFEIKFKVLSSGTHGISWDLSPGQCEYANQIGQVIANSTWSSGTVTCNSIPINVSLGSVNGCSGDTLSIPVSILNGNHVGAISLAFNYNPNSTTFLDVTGIDPAISTLIASTNSFGGLNQIRASWAEVTPVNLNGIAFYLRIIGNNNDNLSFDLTNSGNTEISDSLGNPYSNVTYAGTNTAITTSTTNTTNATACSSYTWSVNNQSYTSSGTYTVTSGCYQEILNLTILPSYNINVTSPLFFGSSYNFNGQIITSAGSYTSTFQSVLGCDSIVNLTLVSATTEITAANSSVSCPGDIVTIPVTINGASNLAAISLALNYNTQALSYVSYSGLNPAIANNFLINNVNGQVRVAWFDLTPANFSAQTVLFNLVFNVQGNSPLSWNTATPGDCELGNLDGNIIPTTFTAGSVTMNGVRAVITAASSTALCTGDQVTLNGPAPAAGVSFQWNLNGAPINGATNASYTASTAGNFSLTVNSGVGCVSNSNTITVSLRTRPSATISAAGLSAGNVAVCQGSSITLNANTGAGFTYQWNLNGNAIIGATAASYSANTAGTYSVTVTNSSEGNGCSATSTAVNVSVNPNSAAAISVEICQGQSYSFGSQTLTASGTYTRNIPAANGCDSVITLTLNVKPAAATSINASICQGQTYTFGSQTLTTSGTYTNTLTAANGCDSVITLNLIVNPTYSASIQASILFGNTYILGSQMITNSGNYTEVFQSSNGCDSTVNLTLNVISPNVTVGNATVCVGDTVTVPVEIVNGNAIGAISLAINYNPSNLTFVGATQINPAVSSSIIVNAGIFNGQNQIRAGWFDLNSISINGLLFNLQFIASANTSLNFDLVTPDICEIADENAIAIPGTTFNNGSVSVLPTPTTNLTQTILSGTSLTICGNTYNTSGSYTIICPNGAANGCDSVINLNLTVISSAPSTTIGSVSGCVGDTVLVPVTVQNGFGIASISMAIGYDPSKLSCINGVTNINSAIANSLLTNCGTFNGVSQFRAAWFDLNPVNLNGNLFTMKFVVLAPGTHDLSWDLATPGNCEYTDAAADVIPGSSWNNGSVALGSGCCSVYASITPSGSTSICQGDSVTLNATSGNGLSYQWYFNGSAISGATNSSLIANSAGSYTVSVSESANCSYTSAAISLTVNPLPSATITAGGATTFCQGASVTLNATTGTGLSYQWLLNNTAIAGATNASLVATAQGSYTVTVTNLNGCSATSSSTSVTVRSLPIATINGASSFCQGANTVLSANTGTGRTYQWRRNNINIIGATSANYTVVTAGTYTVAVTSNSCVAVSNAIVVSVNPLPTVTVDAAGSTSFCQGNSVTLNATTDPSNTVQWRRNGTDIAGATNNTFAASEAGTYTARVTSSTGCSATSNAVQVTVRPNAAVTISDSICQGQLYTFGSQSLSASGTYNLTITAANGCDSIITLNLTVTLPPPPTGLACYQIATYNSTTCSYDISGTVPPAPTNLPCYQSANFDSITCTWVVSGTPNPTILTTISICDTIFNWSVSNQSYNATGTYYYSSNCQDYELRLTLNTPAIITAQPVSQSVNQYDSTSFIVSTLSTTGIINNNNYQWQRSVNNGPFINITNSALFNGTNTNILHVNAATTALHLNKFRCIVTANCGSPSISLEATLDVIPGNPIALTIGNTNICPNSPISSITIPVVSNSFTNVAAMTFNLVPSSGLTYVNLSNIHPLLSGLSSNLVNGKIRVSWFNQSNISLPNNSTLFEISLTANGPGTIEWDTITSLFTDEYNGFRLSTNTNGSINTYQQIIPVITLLSGICENGTPVALSASPAGGTFSGTGVVNGLFDPTISGPGYHNITYTYTTPNGCTFTNSATQYVSALPTGTAGQDITICPGGSAVLTATGGDSYLWSNGSTSSVNQVNPLSSTTYTVTIFNTEGCSITDTVDVIVSGGNSVQITAGDSAFICVGDSVTLSTNGASQVFWYPSNGISSTSSLNPVANPSSTTTYYVIGVNNNGCTSLDSVVIVVNQRPVVTFTIPATACENGAPISLTGSPAGGTFSGPGVSSGNRCNGCPPQFTPSVAGLGNHVITYVYIDPITGCSSSYSQTIEILSSPMANAGPDQNICEGQTTILTASGGGTYLWSNGLTTPSITVNPNSTTVYSVQVTGINGCTSSDETVVYVNPKPTIQISGDTTICIGGSTPISVSGVSSVYWSPSSGISNPLSLNPTFNPTTTTSYTVFGTDTNGCVNTNTVTIVVRPAVSVSAGPDLVSCGSPITLTATAAAGSTFSWSNGQSGQTIAVNPASTTTYLVTATDPNGCTGIDTVIVHVPVLFTGGNRNICRGASTNINANLANFPGNPNNLTYQWSPSTGLSSPVSASPLASPSQTTVYTVSITDTQSNCLFTGTVVVVVLPTPTVDLGTSLTIAPNVAVNLAASVTNATSGTTYTWSMIGTQTGVLTANGNSAQATFTGNSITSIQVQQIVLIASNANGCTGSDTIEITLDPNLAGKNVYGSILYSNPSQSVINSGTVTLVGPSGSLRTTSISPGGTYLFTGVLDSTYTLQTTVSKTPGGITIADAQLINDHATTPFLTGINLKAADVTGDGTILSNDAQQTARRAANLPLSNSFDQNGPGNWVNDSTTISVNGAHISQNLLAISYGDVNSSYTPLARTGTNLLISQKGTITPTNNEIKLPLFAESTYELGSLQFEFEIPTGFKFKGVSSPVVSNWMFNQIGNKGIVVWFNQGENELEVVHGEPLLSLLLQKSPDILSNEDFVIKPIGYQEFNDLNASAITNVRLYAPKVVLAGKQILELHPNPTNDRATLSIQLESPNEVLATLYDLNGRLVQNLIDSKELPAGITTIDFDTKDLPKGTYLVKITSSTEPTLTTNKRLVVVH